VCRLDNCIDKHKLLSDHQYGFRENMSTSMAVRKLDKKWRNPRLKKTKKKKKGLTLMIMV